MRLRAFSHIFQILFLAGGTLLLLLIVLSGSINHFPINRFYWIQGDTSKISGAPSFSRWTFWGICNVSGSNSVHCTSQSPAYPFSPVDNFGTTRNVPSQFITNRDTFYYLTRCSWAFFLISLVFIGVSFISSLFAWFWSSLRSVLTLFVSIGLLFNTTAIAIQTAACVLGKNAFKDANLDYHLGVDLLAIGWASFVVVLFAWFGTCCAQISSAYKKHKEFVANEKGYNTTTAGAGGVIGDDDESYPIPQTAQPAPALTIAQPIPSGQQNQGTLLSNEGGIRFFKIRRNNKGDEESE